MANSLRGSRNCWSKPVGNSATRSISTPIQNETTLELHEERERYHDKNRDQHTAGVRHVSEEARHPHPVFFGNRLDHEIWSVADIGVGTHENRPARNGSQQLLGLGFGWQRQ